MEERVTQVSEQLSRRIGPSTCASSGDRRVGSPPEVHGGAVGSLAVLTARNGDGEATGAGDRLALALGVRPAGVLRQLRQVSEIDSGPHGFRRLDRQIIRCTQRTCAAVLASVSSQRHTLPHQMAISRAQSDRECLLGAVCRQAARMRDVQERTQRLSWASQHRTFNLSTLTSASAVQGGDLDGESQLWHLISAAAARRGCRRQC